MAEGEAFSFFSVSLAEVFNAGPDYLLSTCNPGLIARTVSSQRAHDSSVLIYRCTTSVAGPTSTLEAV